jgi:hypothetical protein
MPTKLTYEQVKARINSTGFSLISTGYKNQKDILDLRCPQGHDLRISLTNFETKQRCKYCLGTDLTTREEIISYIESFNYKFIKMDDSKEKIKYFIECPCGYQYSTKWCDFQKGQRCAKCAGCKTWTLEEIKVEAQKENYEVLSSSYRNNKEDLIFKCPVGHVWRARWNTWTIGCRCRDCGYLAGAIKHTKTTEAKHAADPSIRVESKKKRNKHQREYEKDRSRTNPQHRLRKALRSSLYQSLHYQGVKKSRSTMELVGCSVLELQAYLEAKFKPGMTWDNHGVHGWHVDHILPMSSFDLSAPEQLIKACHYTNLQPLWAIDNLKKHAKIIPANL